MPDLSDVSNKSRRRQIIEGIRAVVPSWSQWEKLSKCGVLRLRAYNGRHWVGVKLDEIKGKEWVSYEHHDCSECETLAIKLSVFVD